MSKVLGWLAPRRKAIAAIVVPLGVWFAARHGLDLTADEAAALTALIGGSAVYFVPNKQQKG